MIDDKPTTETTFLYELARDSDVSGLGSYLKRGETPVVRRRTAEILGDLSSTPLTEAEAQTATDALIRAVREDEDDSVRARAIDALYRYGPDALDKLIDEMAGTSVRDAPEWMTSRTLISWLDAEHPEFRMVAAATLGQIGNERAVRPLLDALTDSSPRVRERAARSCGQLGDRRTVPALIERLDDPELMVRRAAANALGAIGTERALKALVPVARADDEELRRIAVEELGQLGTLEPVVVLLRALTDDSDSVQRTALLSLIQLFVEAPPDQSQEIRDAVADQLERLESEAIVPTLLDVVAESDRLPVRRNGAWLLGRVTGPDGTHRDDVYDSLIDLLDDPDDLTADLAAASLADLGGEELKRRLLIVANDENRSSGATERAERVLDELGGRRELVKNSVDYKYVTDPADYTEQKRNQDDDNGDGA